MKNLRLIRFYGNKRYDPAEFVGKGIRGWWVRVLNRIRFWIECRVVYHVLRLQIKNAGPLADTSAILQEFESDVQAERNHFRQPRKSSPVPQPIGSVQGHRKQVQEVENPRETTARVMARYAAEPRERRYGFSRDHRIMMETDTEIEESPNVQEESRSSDSVPARDVAQEAQRTSLKSYPDNPAPEVGGEDDDGIEFTGFDNETDDPELVRERLRAGASTRTTAAEAAKEHQRSVLP